MNKIFNKLLITIAISFTAFVMQAMEQPIQQQSAKVRIITSDCPDGFEIERAPLVAQSETAKAMLSAPSGLSFEGQTNEISFSDITQQTFNAVYQCMQIVYNREVVIAIIDKMRATLDQIDSGEIAINLTTIKERLTQCTKNDDAQGVSIHRIDSIRAILNRINNGEIAITPATIKDALNAACFLQVSPAVLQALARQYAIYVHDNHITLNVTLDGLIADVLPEIARQYYLHYWIPLQHSSIADGSWGVSVRELLENNRNQVLPWRDALNLSDCYINNLDGLKDIPERDQVVALWLEHNQIAVIKPEVFNGLNNLKHLHLSHNQITTIEKGVFNGLNRLEFLWLDDNRIAVIEPRAFNRFGLNLRNNQITEQDQARLRQEYPNVQIHLENQRKLGFTAIFRPEIKKENIIYNRGQS